MWHDPLYCVPLRRLWIQERANTVIGLAYLTCIALPPRRKLRVASTESSPSISTAFSSHLVLSWHLMGVRSLCMDERSLQINFSTFWWLGDSRCTVECQLLLRARARLSLISWLAVHVSFGNKIQK